MLFPQKTKYALRAIYELAKRGSTEPVKIADVAKAQCIPLRFLEIILHQLKQGGFVDSIRGKDGGYLIVRPAHELTVGEVIRFMQGPLEPVDCVVGKGQCPMLGDCAFEPMWTNVREAVSGVLDRTTMQSLIEDEKRRKSERALGYVGASI